MESKSGSNPEILSNVEKKSGFGVFKGVFTPSILTILGVIMFLRMGWVLGHAGILGTIVIVSLASGITFLTALSIASTATNMKIGGGGAYFMISRSLGVEAGAAVGIPLYFAQSLGISFYLAGFAESLNSVFPMLSPVVLCIGSLFILTALAYFSANFALNIQFIILALIIFSLISFFMGGESSAIAKPNSFSEENVGFWSVFAVFFPAVTGIEAGLSMSGDLANPSKSLPWGTLAAVLVGYIVYLAIPIFLYTKVNLEILKIDLLIMEKLAKWSELIMLGVWGASLSSALGAILGAPRTMQALARDRVIPALFGMGRGERDTPQIASIVTFFVALLAVLLGDLNSIAPVLSMFFLTSYGMLNFSAGMEGLIANPSWRPDFDSPWYLSILGAFACFAVMFMIDAGATIVSLVLTFGVYYFMQKRKMNAYWGDMRRGILTYLAKFSMERLNYLPANTKSWRPNVLVFSGAPARRWYLIELGHAFSSHAGFLSVATILPSGSKAENRLVESQKRIEQYLKNRKVPAFVRLSVADDIAKGIVSLVRDYGLGPIIPNTILLGETEQEDNFEQFAKMVIRIYQAERNCVIVRVPDTYLQTGKDEATPEELKNLNFYFTHNKNKKIDVWWGRQRNNAGLSLALGFLLQTSKSWDGAGLCLKSVVNKKSELQSSEELLQSLINESRLDAEWKIYIEEGQKKDIFQRIREESKDAGFVFMGMLAPDMEKFREDPETTIKEYALYYRSLLEATKDFPPLAIVLAAENLDFHKIFIP
ncbi:MAG: amino acid permease [Oligoflexales bacterium]